MEEQKYYTPAPEDIRLGYEFVFKGNKGAIVSLQAKDIGFVLNSLSSVRVPYLTAEQIENEGWINGESKNGIVRYKKPFYSLCYFSSTYHLDINQYAEEDGEAFCLFSGKCRCINDLRLISKLIGI